MIIVKLMAKRHKHYQNDCELDPNRNKFSVFFAEAVKTMVQTLKYCDVSPHEITIALIFIAKSMKLPFT